MKFLLIAALLAAMPVIADTSLRVEAGSAVIHGVKPAASVVLDWTPVYHQSSANDTVTAKSLEIGITGIADEQRQYLAHAMGVVRYDSWGLGLGAAYLDHEDKYLAGTVQAAALLRYSHGNFSITYRHFSNFGTREPNIGRDIIAAGWRF